MHFMANAINSIVITQRRQYLFIKKCTLDDRVLYVSHYGKSIVCMLLSQGDLGPSRVGTWPVRVSQV